MVKKTISFDDYKNCLLDLKSKSIYRPQLMFGNNKHEIYTVEVNKVALNRDDDKHIVKKDWMSTLARGHNSLCLNYLLTRLYIAKLESCNSFVTKFPL